MKTLWVRKNGEEDQKLFDNIKVFYPSANEDTFVLVTSAFLTMTQDARYYTLLEGEKFKVWIDPLELNSTEVEPGKFAIKIAKSENQSEVSTG